MNAVIVTTTADSEKTLKQIAESLVAEKLAACCQISGPVTSIYRWHGKIESSAEYHCTIKTTSGLVSTVIDGIKKLHPYDEPEIVVTEIVGGSESYINWIFDSVGAP